MHVNVKMFDPCPKAVRGTEKVLTNFSLSVWLTTGLVLHQFCSIIQMCGNSFANICAILILNSTILLTGLHLIHIAVAAVIHRATQMSTEQTGH